MASQQLLPHIVEMPHIVRVPFQAFEVAPVVALRERIPLCWECQFYHLRAYVNDIELVPIGICRAFEQLCPYLANLFEAIRYLRKCGPSPIAFQARVYAGNRADARVGGLYVDVVCEHTEGFLNAGVFLTHVAIGKCAKPLLVALLEVPSPVKYVLVEPLAYTESFERAAKSHKVVSAVFVDCRDAATQLVEVSGEVSVSAEVTQEAEIVWLAVEVLVEFVDFSLVAEIVEHSDLPVRNCFQIGFYIGRFPMLLVEIEHPAHLKPYGIWVSCCKCLVNVVRDAGENLRVPVVSLYVFEEIDFVENVESIDVAGAEHLSLFFDEKLLDFLEKWVGRVQEPASVFRLESIPFGHFLNVCLRIESGKCGRNLSVECRKDRFHIQFALALEYLFLELGLSVYEFLRKRSFPSVDIHHSIPRKERRTGEAFPDFVLLQSEVLPYLHKYGFFAGDVQRLCDAVKRHPVYHPRPLFPSPPRHSVSVGAVV